MADVGGATGSIYPCSRCWERASALATRLLSTRRLANRAAHSYAPQNSEWNSGTTAGVEAPIACHSTHRLSVNVYFCSMRWAPPSLLGPLAMACLASISCSTSAALRRWLVVAFGRHGHSVQCGLCHGQSSNIQPNLAKYSAHIYRRFYACPMAGRSSLLPVHSRGMASGGVPSPSKTVYRGKAGTPCGDYDQGHITSGAPHAMPLRVMARGPVSRPP